ncbi:MAG: hypothetical protein II972_02315 [Elusimicrobiaceae bacterium]|nr:hypothetical protein [Elusimicrobiaceae bacterium]
MKVVFFDIDDFSKDYIKNKVVCNCKILMTQKSLDNLTPQELNDFKDADIISIFVHSNQVLKAKNLDNFTNLKLITTRSTGYDHIDLEYCKKRNIAVANVPKYGEITVAEYTMGLLLNISRKIILAKNDMVQGKYTPDAYTGLDLFGKTIGIIGTGAIGRHMIKLSKGFSMEVIAYDPYPNEEFKRLYNFEYVTLEELLKKSDIISLHAPSTKENYHLLNEETFKKMKKGVIILNTARGDLIDSEALYKNIVNKKVAGAGLDVLENEELLIQDDIILNQQSVSIDFAMDTIVNNKLLKHNNVVITPHMAFNSIDAVHRILDITLKNIEAFKAGKMINQVK